MGPTSIQRSRTGTILVTDLTAADPDYLRETVVRSLSSLTFEQRSLACEQLLADLEKAGLNIRQAVLMLGLLARKVEELTAPEIGTLIRYARLTEPKVMRAMAAPLTKLLGGNAPAKASHLAA
jgi:hypothetical protein